MRIIIRLIVLLLLSSPLTAQNKKLMNADQFEKAIFGGDVQIVDVRRPDEFSGGHIKGAVNANWQNLDEFAKKTDLLEKSRPVYVYCHLGIRSLKASDWLLKKGFKNVINLDGGIQEWENAGKPLE